MHTLAQLISAYSLVDPEKAKVYPFNGGERGLFGYCFLGFSAVWGLQTHSYLKKGKEPLWNISRSSCLELHYFSNWFHYCDISEHIYLWPLSL